MAAATTTATALFLCWRALAAFAQKEKENLVRSLPASLCTWRVPPCEDDEYEIWQSLAKTLKGAGLTLWDSSKTSAQRSPYGSDVFPNGYLHTAAIRGTDKKQAGAVATLRHLWPTNASSHVVRTREGQDAVMRVVAIGHEGRDQLRIWRKLATAPHALISANHTLPLLQEFDLEHITFGIFPLVAQPMEDIYGRWAKNSVGDILDAVMQALEALAYIHSLGIAHRDAFKYNFLMQWHPESLLTGSVAVSRPRVYLIDFEVAVEFSGDSVPSERVCIGPPCIGSLSDPTRYSAPCIPEMCTGEPYDPFKLDVWQLGTSLLDFDSTLPPVQAVLQAMASLDPAERLTADDALCRLRAFLENVPPKSLLIPP
ncbi:hypothetical protein BD626DRAFT_568499 [Schizophyllum amplum]|uniref:Protein kinase domain-containing protein n=1 Tax=Schizophyllum amplum TaxID=97359 RepID=A0A550CGI3_9AGAR|nr:hypothetical protein BD626DRAFT_568499 [Auriculariopsis ampla]